MDVVKQPTPPVLVLVAPRITQTSTLVKKLELKNNSFKIKIYKEQAEDYVIQPFMSVIFVTRTWLNQYILAEVFLMLLQFVISVLVIPE